MRRQLIGVLLISSLIMGGGLQVRATEQTGTIRVSMDHGNASVGEATVTLHQVGTVAEDGYRLLQSLGGGLIRHEDVQMADLARWMEAEVTDSGKTQLLQEDGTGIFSGLQEGLYLLVQTEAAEGFQAVNPFLIPIPWNGAWDLTILPRMREILTESPKTGQHPAPLIGAMVLVLSGMGLVFCLEKIRRK